MKKSCNGCYFEHNKLCYWFKLAEGNNPKIIPLETFDKGCVKYKNNQQNVTNDVIEKFINKFDGEIIGDKYTPKPFFYKTKKKTYTTRHRYTERKDAQ
tara:strand:+ start:1097 stop:1390 length:294 start_codon:yes stop_codon:yes gene_type:complete